jgi:hypothetical protein
MTLDVAAYDIKHTSLGGKVGRNSDWQIGLRLRSYHEKGATVSAPVPATSVTIYSGGGCQIAVAASRPQYMPIRAED